MSVMSDEEDPLHALDAHLQIGHGISITGDLEQLALAHKWSHALSVAEDDHVHRYDNGTDCD